MPNPHFQRSENNPTFVPYLQSTWPKVLTKQLFYIASKPAQPFLTRISNKFFILSLHVDKMLLENISANKRNKCKVS
jgi:hypothetical protein